MMSGRTCLPGLAVVACLLSYSGALDAQAQDFQLRIEVPNVGLAALSEFHAAVVLDSAVEGVQGWSFGVTHDEATLELLVAEAGAATLTANNGAEPEFQVLDTDTVGGAGLTHAVVLSIEDRSVVLPAADGQELVTMQYRILADPAGTEPCETITTSLQFTDELANDAGSPTVSTLVTVGGANIPVETSDGTVAVACPDSIITTECEALDEDVSLQWVLSPNVPVEKLDFILLYRDGEFLETLDVATRSYFDADVEPGLRQYTLVSVYFSEGGSPNLVFGYCAVTVAPVTLTGIEPAVGNWLGGETVTVRGTEFTSARSSSLVLQADGEEPLPLDIVEVVDSTTMTVLTPEAPSLGIYDLVLENEKGSAEIPDGFEIGFTRGDSNADRDTNLSDAIFLLDFLFVGGGGAPRCLDAADVDNSGAIDVSDAIFLLDFLFRAGDPVPPPFAEPGQDDGEGPGCLE